MARIARSIGSRLVIVALMATNSQILRADDAGSRSPGSSTRPAEKLSREKRDGPVLLRVEIDRDRTDLATPIRMTMTLEMERGVEAELPKIEGAFGDFVVKESNESQRRDAGDRTLLTQSHILEAVRPGAAAAGSIAVEFVDSRERLDGSPGESRGRVELEALSVSVEGDLADAKGPVSLSWAGLAPIWWWIIGVLLATAAVGLSARWWVGHKRAPAIVAAKRALIVPAHEWALAELGRLVAEGLVSRGLVQEFYYRINALLREYIERRFGIMAGEQTSEEFIRSLRESQLLNSVHKGVLQQFVDSCDPVKYAKQIPGADDVQWVQQTAREFIVESADRGGGNGEALGHAGGVATAVRGAAAAQSGARPTDGGLSSGRGLSP